MAEPAVVTEMPNGGVTPDGTIAMMEFKNSDGSVQILHFRPDTMLGFVNRVFQLFNNQRIQTAAAAGHIEAQPMKATASHATPTMGGAAVIIGFRMENGLPVEFSITADEAEELHHQLGKAVKKARREAASGRH